MQDPDIKEAFQDPKFVNELLSQIPGADQNSEEVQKALEDLHKKKDPPKSQNQEDLQKKEPPS